MRAVGLFAGIGGIELGLHRAGFRTELLCEIDDSAVTVLRDRFPESEIALDIRTLPSLPRVDVVAGGFPCQDLSQAGKTAGIRGRQSGLVDHVFRLIEKPDSTRWLLLENVSFMLQLDGGRAMAHLTRSLEDLGFSWAYRVVDSRAFGVPHRRQRVLLLASRTEDPRPVLFGQDAGAPPDQDYRGLANGFYWTEGLRGLGWAVDAVPTLKGGSTVGIPSPPAVWMPDGSVGKPEIRDAERLQGFSANWTRSVASRPRGEGARWKLVGNAVTVPVAEWLGHRLVEHSVSHSASADKILQDGGRWPRAAWGTPSDKAHEVDVSLWPIRKRTPHLSAFLRQDLAPLSVRACDGFLSRASRSSLRFPQGLLEAVEAHRARMAAESA